MRKKFFLLALAAMLLPLFASAETVEIDGICYNLIPKGSAAEVAKKESGYYSGDIVIPSSFVYNGVNYNVVSINAGAFFYCKELHSVTIPNGVGSIGSSAFGCCSELKSITIPSSVTSIGKEAFTDCKSLTSVDISDVGAWCRIDFKDNPLTYAHHLYLNGKEVEELIIPDDVTTIDSKAFSNCESFKSVVIGNGITYITGFENCANLTSITIGSNVESIWAFRGCNKLESVYISDLAKWCSIRFGKIYDEGKRIFSASRLFLNGKEVKDLAIPEGVTEIKDYAFQGFKYIVSVTIPNSVTSIGNFAFSGNAEFSDWVKFEEMGMSSITIGNGLKNVGYNVFDGCKNLASVHISDLGAWCGINYEQDLGAEIGRHLYKRLGNPLAYAHHLYMNGNEIKNLTIPDGVTGINDYAFYGLTELTSVSIPGSLTSIGKEAFGGCDNLKFVHLSDLSSWCNIDLNDSPLSKVLHLYMDGKEITELVIPDGVTKIKSYAFYGCNSLKSVRIPASVTDIWNGAFAFCEELTNVTCLAKSVPRTSSNAFDNSYIEYATLHVGKSSVDAYKSATPWNKFKSIDAIEIPKHTLTYMIDVEVYKTVEYEEGDNINVEADPEKEGYTFSGWSTIPSIMPNEDVIVSGTFIPNKYKLTYYVDPFGVVKEDSVECGATIIPYNYEPTGALVFYGWDNIPETMPAHDVTVSGRVNTRIMSVTYIVDGEVYMTYSYPIGQKIDIPEPPMREGYTFSGWSDIPSTMPNHAVTVYGTFTINRYKLIYMIDGSEYKTIEVEYGSTITHEEVSDKEGYTFTGWDDLPDTMPGHDVTVTGSYTVNKYKLIYMVDGEVYMTIEVEYGASITPEDEPTKDGYVFSGWSWMPSKMPAEDVTVSGTFKQIGYNIDDNIYVVDGNEVTLAKSNVAGGDIIISPTVIINNNVYNVTTIGQYAFANNNGIKSVTIPDGVTTIGDNAFEGCSGIRKITLGKDVGFIGRRTFADIFKSGARTRSEEASLTVECHADKVPGAYYDSFEGTDISSAVLKVNDDLVSTFKATSPWNGFGAVIGFNEAEALGIGTVMTAEKETEIFSIDGRRQNKTVKGLNIIRTSQGTRKVMVR